MAIKIVGVDLIEQNTTVGTPVLVQIKISENTWESVIIDCTSWQDVIDKYPTWQDVKNI